MELLLVRHCFPLYLEVGEGVVERGRERREGEGDICVLKSFWLCPRKIVRDMWG